MHRFSTRRPLLPLAVATSCLLAGIALVPTSGWPDSARAEDHKADDPKLAPLDADKIGAAAGADADDDPGWRRPHRLAPLR